MSEERIWGEGPEGEMEVFRYINDHAPLLSMLYDLDLLPEQHPDPESKERWMIFNIVNHWRENDLQHEARQSLRPEGGAADTLEWECKQGDKICEAAGVQRTEGGSLNPAKIINALRAQGTKDVLEQIEQALRKNSLIAMFIDQGFWHAHHVDIVIRYNGHDKHFEADWIVDLWRIVRRRGLSATEAVAVDQRGPQREDG